MKETSYPIFELFEKQWALVTAGSPEHFNCCTLSWGGMGTLWNRPVVTVYVHPARYTRGFLNMNDFFTISFFPEECRKSLGVLGTLSGRDGDKITPSGLSPVAMGKSVTYKEAELCFLCRKLYQHPFSRDDLDKDIQEYYQAHPSVYPPDGNGDWQPHWVFVGEIVDSFDRRGDKQIDF